ncbi:MAG: hypothetical protein HY275_09950 [Gemmatimonadetes bacterium]|nr:hypothetical protein [Gemmatimonadota bacterium]
MTSSSVRAGLTAAGLAVGVASALAAQDATSFRAGPSFVSYTVAGQTTSQIAIPMVALIPVSQRFTIDIATAFASTQASLGGATSTISGLTDTQLRANWSVGSGDNMVITFGLNIPTGKSSVSSAELSAAQAIGLDLYTYPVPAYGSGLAGTLGLAYAGQAGDWELGTGASYRKATEYEPLSGTTTTLKFTPGDEFRLRFGAARPVGDGRLSLGLIFSAFGSPKLSDTTTVNTGPRAIFQAVYAKPVGSNELFFTLWNLYTGSGKLLAGQAEASNITNLGVAYGIHAGSVTWEPNVEARFLTQGSSNGNLFFPGVRVRIPAGAWVVYPGAAAAFGNVSVSGASSSVSGFRATLGVQYTP